MGFLDFFRKKKTQHQELEPSESYRLTILYKYSNCDDICSHPGCLKLLELNRYYNRVEIQTISMKVGHDVFNRGFSGKCNHRFESVRVKIKSSESEENDRKSKEDQDLVFEEKKRELGFS